MSNMDEESRAGFLHGIRCYQDLLRQLLREANAQAHPDDAAQPSAGGDDQLAGAAAPPRNNHDSHSASYLHHQDPILRAIMETLYNDDELEYIEYDQDDNEFQPVISGEGPHEEAYNNFLTQRVEADLLEQQFREVVEFASEPADVEEDDDDDILEGIYQAVANGRLLIPQLAQAIPARLDDDESYSYYAGFHGVPASSVAIASLEKQKFFQDLEGNDDHSECPICLKEYEVDEELSVMPCTYRHRYHQGCLAKWLERNHSCPLCRHALPTMEQQEQGIQY